MPQQILTPAGKSIWSHRDCQFVGDIQPGDCSFVSWRDTEWFLKFKDQSVNEVIGYQLADFLGLPLQPWLAVELDEEEWMGVEKPNVAILIQKWPTPHWPLSLERPIAKNPAVVGRALALATLITDDAEWMSDGRMDEIRLVDLEFCGPAITLLESGRWVDLVDGYLEGVRWNVCRCYGLAHGVIDTFFQGIRTIADANLVEVLDFTAHSRARVITNAAVSFLKPAQKMISRILQ